MEMIIKETTKCVRSLGITSRYMGYYYTIEAVNVKLQFKDEPIRITKDIYPKLAKKFHTSETSIEHGIRAVSRLSWRENPEKLKKLSDVPLEFAPTNSVFVDILAYKVKRRQEKKEEKKEKKENGR